MSPHPYDRVVVALRAAFEESQKCGLEDAKLSKGVGEILLAHDLGHELVRGDKGADAFDPKTGERFEYKVSCTNQFNFNVGPRGSGPVALKIRRAFDGISGAYCARRRGSAIVRVEYCPAESLIDDLVRHVGGRQSKQLQKVYSLDTFSILAPN